MTNDWGFVEMADGTIVPLQEPEFLIPEENRVVVVDQPGIKLWMEKDKKMPIIESADYEQTRCRLMKDPTVIAMAEELKGHTNVSDLHHGEPDKTPRGDFMMAANKEYRSRNGKDGGHMGAIAEAIIRLLEAP